ncbi:hypothetical protein DRJ19_06020 [Candidatus Woesearchaeota archaeon]|nr:MAG: hypothetical protein DRJ19_06020 [Candidatus Woesearchaeota archaeon]
MCGYSARLRSLEKPKMVTYAVKSVKTSMNGELSVLARVMMIARAMVGDMDLGSVLEIVKELGIRSTLIGIVMKTVNVNPE